ncbi:MAG: glycoside hydrolase family 44 protein [Polyangiales bacterium]
MKRAIRLWSIAGVLIGVATACGDSPGPMDGAAMDASASDRSMMSMPDVVATMDSASGDDAAVVMDSGVPSDTGVSPPADAAAPTDTGVAADSGVPAGDASVITPGDPGASQVRFSLYTQQQRRPISRYIYGTNQPNWSTTARRLTLGRAGGNRWTAYNWENNASNAGTDWMNQNDGYLSASNTPGEAVRQAVAAAHAAGASQIVTLPIVGYVAADKSPGGDVNATPNYLTTRFRVSAPRKGSAFSLMPDTSDARVYQDEFVNWCERTFPMARGDAQRTIFYMLDNEPDLWNSTHPRIHPNPVTYAEIVQRSTDYAAAVKSVAPNALVFSLVSYGWAGYANLQDAPDAMGRDFLDYYLASMRAAERTAGRRLVDVLDLHWYPEARGGGTRIITNTNTAAINAARVQAPRSLWDPSYREDSWISVDAGVGPIRLIPRVLEKINTNYPGTLLSISEYNYGGGNHVSGAIAQADALGIFGREGVFAAALWEMDMDERFIYGGFSMFRDYDGAGAAFGDISVRADNSDHAQASVYASVDSASADRVVLVAINKSNSALTAGITVAHTAALTRAEAFVLSGTNPAPQRVAAAMAPTISATNAVRYSMPAMSVTTIVLR